MPDRILRAGILDSDRVNELSWAAEVFYRRLMSVADDYGRFDARPSKLRASLYVLKLDRVSEPDIVKWLGECSKAGLVRMYTVNKKQYLEILDFNQRLRAMKSKYPPPLPEKGDLPSLADNCGHVPADVRKLLTDDSLNRESDFESETENEKLFTPIGVGEAGASPPDLPVVYEQLKKNKDSVWAFIKANAPDFIEPYADLWNFFAKDKGLAQVTKISNGRKRKFKVRIKEKGFDFLAIIKKATESEFLITSGKWFCFDWILENESNYLKVIEGNYDKKPPGETVQTNQKAEKPAQQTFGEIIGYLFDRYKEGALDIRLILPEYYDKLVVRNVMPAGTSDKMPGATIEERKIQAVVELFKLKSTGHDHQP